MPAGGVTTLVIETDTYCDARPAGGPIGPSYREVSVTLRDGVLRTRLPPNRPGLDMGCGALVSKFGRWL
jgi:hypothetical protein